MLGLRKRAAKVGDGAWTAEEDKPWTCCRRFAVDAQVLPQ